MTTTHEPQYLDAELCGHEYPDEGDAVHVAGDPVDMICLASPIPSEALDRHDQARASLVALKKSALSSASHALLADCDETGAALIDVAIHLDAVLKHFDGNGDPDLLVAEAFIDVARRTIHVLGTGHRIAALGKAMRS